MITQSELPEMIAELGDRFEPILSEFCKEWDDYSPPGDPPIYFLFSLLAREIAQDLRTGNTGQLPQAFEFIEKIHLEGDPHVREAATVGLLENIQNVMLADNTGLHLAHPFLGPVSKKWWDKVIIFWNGDMNALREN